MTTPSFEQKSHFAWRVPCYDEDGIFSHWVIPHGDPYNYESPFDAIYSCHSEAVDHLKEAVENGEVEPDEVGDFHLFHVAESFVKSATELLNPEDLK